MSFVPLNHQISGANFLIRHRWAILSDCMGSGKSATTLLAVKQLKIKTLVICPAFLKGVWVGEINKFFPELSYHVCTNKDLPKKITADVTIANYEQLPKLGPYFSQVGGVILDECHYIKNMKATRTKLLHTYARKSLPGYLWGLSGTPIKNNIPEFWSVLRLMSMCPSKTNGANAVELYRNYWGFCTAFCNEVRKRIGRATFRSYEGFKNQEKFRDLLLAKYIRRTLKDLDLNLPPEVNIFLPIAKLSREKQLAEAYSDYEMSKIKNTSTPEKVKAALDKTSYTSGVIREFLEQCTTPLLVFSDYIHVAETLYGEFKSQGAQLLTGNVNPTERFRVCQEFQTGSIPLLCCTIGSTKEGLTLTAAHYAVFNDLPWVPSDLAQVRKRISRIGQTETCFYYMVVAPGIDENINKKLMEKAKILSQSLSAVASPYDALA